MRKHGLFWALVLVLAAAPAYAQKFTSTLRGTVTDPTGAVIAGAKVTVTNEGTGLTRTASPTSAGIYSFAELPVGSYRIQVENQGFKSEVRSKIALNVADARAVDAPLQTGDLTEGGDVWRGAGGRGQDRRRRRLRPGHGRDRARAAAQRPQLHAADAAAARRLRHGR